jgi:hypothetical protein
MTTMAMDGTVDAFHFKNQVLEIVDYSEVVRETGALRFKQSDRMCQLSYE